MQKSDKLKVKSQEWEVKVTSLLVLEMQKQLGNEIGVLSKFSWKSSEIQVPEEAMSQGY
jgi:hypothetical protein